MEVLHRGALGRGRFFLVSLLAVQGADALRSSSLLGQRRGAPPSAERLVSFEVSVSAPRRVREPEAASPVTMPYGASFVQDHEIVLGSAEAAVCEDGADVCDALQPGLSRAFLRAGPRSKVSLNASSVAAIVTCGGLCPGLNTVVQELVRALWFQYGVRTVYGVQGGYHGLAGGRFEAMTPSTSMYTLGGTVLGTSRGRQCAVSMIEKLESHDVSALFVVGGDGTIRGAQMLCEELKLRGSTIGVGLVPKTIDNDIPIIDQSFGFDTAVAAAKSAIDSAVVESRAFPRGVAVVRLMGRDAGFLACHAALAAPGDVDAVLVPEQVFKLDGENGLLAYLDTLLEEKDHAVVVVAEGVASRLLNDDGSPVGDVGTWLCSKIKDHFADDAVSMKYVDPSYMVRALASNAADNILCSRLAANAVHGVFSGYTEFAVATINTHYALVPLSEFANRKNLLALSGRLWQDLVRSTGQPSFIDSPGEASGDVTCDDEVETPSGGCVVSYD